MSMPSRVVLTPNCSLSRATVGDLAGVQQRLGRDAAAVQAGAADLVLLDQHDGLAELGCSQRRGVAAAAAAEDDEIGLMVGHGAPVLPVTSSFRSILALRQRLGQLAGTASLGGDAIM